MKAEKQKRVAQKAGRCPKTDDELHEWLRDVLGLRYARHATKEGHRPPFDFIADVFFERTDTALCRACRGGGKTIGFGAIYTLNCQFKEGYDIVHIGGSEQQSKLGYAYVCGDADKDGFLGFARRPPFDENLAETMVSRTVFKNGAKLEIRTGGSSKSVSGPHPHMLGIDELDHIVVPVLNTALQMPISKGQYNSQTIMGSSQYAYYGTLQTMLDEAPQRGIDVYEYDLFDVMTPCGRSYPYECGECPFYEWHNPFTGKHEELCQGRGARSNGHYAYRDAISKYLMTTDLEAFALQMLLLRGTSQGMVFSTFNEDIHVKSFPPPEADLSTWRCFAGVDLRSHGRIEVVAEAPEISQSGRRLRWVIREWADDNSTPSKVRKAAFELREDIKAQYGLSIDVFWMEPSGADEARDWQSAGLNGRIIPKDVRQVLYRIGQVRDALLDAQKNVSLYVDPSCEDLIRSMSKLYHCTRKSNGEFDRDKPAEAGSHSPDALGYAYVGGPLRGRSALPDVENSTWQLDGTQRWSPV